MAVSTPWGASQHSTQITRGAVFHSTSGHGGLHIAERLAGRILSSWVRNKGIKDGSGYWYEEDCEISLPLYELFLNGYKEEVCRFCGRNNETEMRDSLENSIRNWNGEYFKNNEKKYRSLPIYEKLEKDWKIRFNDGCEFKVVGREDGKCLVSYLGTCLELPKRVYFRGTVEIADGEGKTIWSEK